MTRRRASLSVSVEALDRFNPEDIGAMIRSGKAHVDARGHLVLPKAKRARKESAQVSRAALYAQMPREAAVWLLFVPIKLVSELNQRESWVGTYRRKKAQQEAVAHSLLCGLTRPELPCTVSLTRYGVGALDTDARASCFKHVQDEVARWLGCDDGDASKVTWEYRHEQAKRADVSVAIRVTSP